MEAVKLELRCPQTVGGITVDPQPDWSFDTLASEIAAIEKKLNASSVSPAPFTKSDPRRATFIKDLERRPGAFVVRAVDFDSEDLDEYEDEDPHPTGGKRFACDELYTSDSEDYEDESAFGTECHLMNKVGLVEGALAELNHEHQLSVTEEIRNQILALETNLMNENEKFSSALAQVEKYNEAQRELDRRHDMQYQRKIAEALDDHLTALRRDFEHRSQMEERRIRDDAAYEEARKREQALRDEKAQQQKLKAETEMLARLEAEKKRSDEAKAAAALEADKKTAKDVATAAALAPPKEVAEFVTNEQKKVQSTGNTLKGADNALKLEERRLQIYDEVVAKNKSLGLGSNKEYRSHANRIARQIRTINGTKDSVRSKTDELVKLICNSPHPQTIGIETFAKELVEQCVNPNATFSNAVCAYGHVIVRVTSKVPLAMEILLAELNRACIYTVPKYISYSKLAFESKEAYYKAIGYKEEEGKIEGTESYEARIRSCMRLYGALVQTEAEGVKNLHGIREGWAWFARFLNYLPADHYTAVALEAFLETTGFALYKRYKSQFKKILNIISRDFIKALKERGDQKLDTVARRIQKYIDSNNFLKEPEGCRLQNSLISDELVPEADDQEQRYNHGPSNSYNHPSSNSYYNPPSNRYTYTRYGNY